MHTPRTTHLVFAAVLLMTSVAGTASQSGRATTDLEARVDRVFEKWTLSTPGCAVGVSRGGRPVLVKAYGMADLEHDVRNTTETIFEAGSVSKQFTAAAVLLLARDGRLSLDDPARQYIPELPDYGQPLTIRHMLNHTSGLRDWGNVAAIGGWPRTTRVHTHAHVLDIVSRQRALNFTPGTRYSYSNSGYNLAAIIVSRVSGLPFAEFTRRHLFEPLAMRRTSWRDDHGRIVRDRAMSYSDEQGHLRTLMPFENVHGNGGLLTTVGDLLKWNENFTTYTVGDRAFVEELERPGRFNDGRAHGYALGLRVDPYKGLRQVAHSGSTAGYRAQLSRYPDQQISVAVLCNASNANATDYADAVADLYLGDRIKPATTSPTYVLTEAELGTAMGVYRSTLTGEPLTLIDGGQGLRIQRGTVLTALSPRRFVTPAGNVLELGEGTAQLTDLHGTVEVFAREKTPQLTQGQLRELVGTYQSDEAEAVIKAEVEGDGLVLERRPDTTIRLTPVYPDAFTGQIGTVIFRREGGHVTSFSVVQDRVWDLRFTKR